MEDEKKKAADVSENRGHKNRHGRRKSYFIEPAKSGSNQPIAVMESNAAKPQKEKLASDKRADGEGGHSHKHHHGKHRPNHRVEGDNRNHQNPQKKPPVAEENTPVRDEQRKGEPNRNKKFHGQKHKQPSQQGHQKNESPKVEHEKEAPRNGSESGQADPKKNNRNRNRNRRGDREHSRQGEPKDLLLTDTLASVPSFFAPKQTETAEAEEEIIPYIPADDDDLSGQRPKADPEGPLVEVVGIRFKPTGKVYYFAPGSIRLTKGSYAIVETARGQEYGEVALGNTMVSEQDTVPPLRPIVRGATEADVLHHAENKKKEEDAFRICNEKILAHGLDMKLIDAQYTFDNTKLLFYFTSSGRVDFRELVKDLASVFRTRIELRQIGIRDEAKMMGGLGPCGRPLCCTLFLTDFGQVSIKMAKEQNLSLNSSKISGICGRLMCCLRYEYETYEYEIKRTPPVDSLVKTEDGVGVVTEMNPLLGTVKVRLTATPDVAPKVYQRDQVVVLQRKQEKSDKGEKNENSEKSDK